MAIELFTNQATTTVASGGTTAPSPGTVESWTVASSSSFPAASNSSSPPTQFHVCDTASGKTTEIILVTNVSGTTWTVTRGAEGSTPVAHTAGFTIQQVATAGWLGTGVTYAAGGGRETTANNAAATGSVTFDITNGNVLTATLTGNVTATFAGAASGVACSFTLYLTQDATGGRSVTWPGSVTWIGGTQPTANTAPSAVNIYIFQTTNGGTTWYGSLTTNAPALPLTVANGGTGGVTMAAFELVTGGVTSTSPVQGVASSGTTGNFLLDEGSSAVPAFGQPPLIAPTGLTGATAASRYVGATASGAPASGTFAKGDYVIDQTGVIWVCTTAGTPGTWTSIGTVTSVTAGDSSVTVTGTQAAVVSSVSAQLVQRIFCV